jgi:hypothetical protein
MDNNINNVSTINTNDSSSYFPSKNALIIILLLLLIFSFLGINLLSISGGFIQTISNIFGPLVKEILSTLGYTTGTVIDKSSDFIADTSIAGIQIANGTFNSIGDLLKKASQGNINEESKKQLDSVSLNQTINTASQKLNEPTPNSTSSPIQSATAITTSPGNNWCLVGEYQGRRGCVELGNSDKCLSGQVFPSQKICLNPTITNNVAEFLKSRSENETYQPSPNLSAPKY